MKWIFQLRADASKYQIVADQCCDLLKIAGKNKFQKLIMSFVKNLKLNFKNHKNFFLKKNWYSLVFENNDDNQKALQCHDCNLLLLLSRISSKMPPKFLIFQFHAI